MSIFYGSKKVAGKAVQPHATSVTVDNSPNKSGKLIANINVDGNINPIYAPYYSDGSTVINDFSLPIGSIIAYASKSLNPPEGWLFCDGSEVLIESYPELYTAVADAFGSISLTTSSNKFKLPSIQNATLIAGVRPEYVGTQNITKAISGSTGTTIQDIGLRYIIKYKHLYTSNINYDLIYPIGSIYISLQNTASCPLTFGTWKKIGDGKCLMGQTDTTLVGTTIKAGLPKPTIASYAEVKPAGEHFHTVTYNVGNCGCGKDGGIRSSHQYNTKNNANTSDAGIHTHEVVFTAYAQSDKIYGQSTTVQPPALVVVFWQRIS